MDCLKIARDVVQQATARGIEAEAYIQIGQETEILVDRGNVEKLSQAGSKGLGVRVVRDGRTGYAYTSDFAPESITQTMDDAVALSEVADADENRSLPDPLPIPDENLVIYDPAIVNLSAKKKVEMARQIEQAALNTDERMVMTNLCTLFSLIETVAIANSRGIEGCYDKTYIGAFLMALAQEGEEKSAAFDVGIASRLSEFNPEEVGRKAAEKAVGMLGGKPVPTQKATVVYSPLAAHSIAGALSQALNAEAMQRQRSFLQDKVGQTVASTRVTLVDNGRLTGGLGTRPFDDEGVPTTATRLIDEGVLQNVLYDHYTAQRAGNTSSTGNASRNSHRSLPTLMASNFYFQPGSQTPEQVIANVEKGLYVESVMNTHSINPISGDYSVSAKGHWIENGQRTHPVNEVTIAISLQDLLKNVKAVANDLIFMPMRGALGSPTIRVDDVMIGGSDAASP